MLMTAAMALQAPQAGASCVRLNPGDQDLTVSLTMPNIDRPDTRYRVASGGAVLDSFECTAGQTAFNIDAPLTGLTYVRDVQMDSYLYKVYSTGPRSPLIGFSFSVQKSGTTIGGPPIAVGSSNRHPGVLLTAPGPIRLDAYMVIFFRGGAMESIPMTDLGTITSSVEGDPSQSMQHHVRLEIIVPPVTCTLANASHALDDVLANELAASGSNAKESSFDVTMNCPMDNIDVQLSLADANDPGSSNGQLAPAPGANAGGVQVQLLRGGQPVQFGQAWSNGWSNKGQQGIPFSARYLRTADPLVPGLVKGEAVLTADYR
jgi:type 1 fimbria pilin